MRFGRSGRGRSIRVMLRVASVAPLFFLLARPCLADPAIAEALNEDDAGRPPDILARVLGGIELGVGSSELSGDFGAPKTTNVAAVLATASYRVDNLRLTASLPWMRIDSSGAVFTEIEGTPIIADPAASGRRLREGIGDLTLGASYLLPASLTPGLDTDLSFRVKVPTASQSSRLSTGEVDYSFGGTFQKPIGRFAPLLSVFYRSFGSGPEFQLRSGFATSVGATYAFNPQTVGLITYDYAQRSSQFISDAHQITSSLTSQLPNSPVRLTGFVGGGLSRGAPAISAGLAISLRL